LIIVILFKIIAHCPRGLEAKRLMLEAKRLMLEAKRLMLGRDNVGYAANALCKGCFTHDSIYQTQLIFHWSKVM